MSPCTIQIRTIFLYFWSLMWRTLIEEELKSNVTGWGVKEGLVSHYVHIPWFHFHVEMAVLLPNEDLYFCFLILPQDFRVFLNWNLVNSCLEDSWYQLGNYLLYQSIKRVGWVDVLWRLAVKRKEHDIPNCCIIFICSSEEIVDCILLYSLQNGKHLL